MKRTYFILNCFLQGIGPFCLIALCCAFFLFTSLSYKIQKDLETQAQEIITLVEDTLQEKAQTLAYLSKIYGENPQLLQKNNGRLEGNLENLGFSSLYAQNTEGFIIASTSPEELGKKISQAEWLQMGLEGKSYFGPFNSSNFKLQPGIVLTTPLSLSIKHPPFGVLMGIIEGKWLKSRLFEKIKPALGLQDSDHFVLIRKVPEGTALYATPSSPSYETLISDSSSYLVGHALTQGRENLPNYKWEVLVGLGHFSLIHTLKPSLGKVLSFLLLLYLSIVGWIFFNLYKNKSILENELKYRSIAEATPIPVLTFNPRDGKILEANLPVCEILDLPQRELLGRCIWNYFNRLDDKDYLERNLENKNILRDWEVSMKSATGRSFWAGLSTRIIDYGGVTAGIMGFYDITHRKEIERQLEYNAQHLEKTVELRTQDLAHKAQELERTNEELEKARLAAELANSSKSQFLANMSHELRTPLNAVIGYSEILQEEAEANSLTTMIEDLVKINNAGKHLLNLINDVLDLSKIEAGKMELHLETFNVIDMIQGVEGIVKPLIEKKKNRLNMEYPSDIGSMTSDLTKMRQNLFNLLSNASKFTEQGQITLRVAKIKQNDMEFLEFSVIDTGIGMTPEQVSRMFKAFTQADESTTRKYGGTGLGLTITRKFCQLLGGDATVSSVYGQGSTFTLLVPVDSTFIQEQRNQQKLSY